MNQGNGVGVGVAEESFGSRAMTTTGETQQTALAARATANVQARYVMAMKNPRSWEDVRVRILRECARPGFAEVARYNKPIGRDGIQGPSIRFAEACVRYAGNLDASTATIYEDRFKRVLEVRLTDYETNTSYAAEITVDKTIERKQSKDRVVVSQRQNSYGDTVFIVEATEDELLNKTSALVSKSVRTLALRLIPGDIIDEGQQACIETLRNRAAKDPGAEKKKLIDAFAGLGVMPSDLAAWLGHPIDATSPAEIVDLRAVYSTIRDGEATWRAVIDARMGDSAKAEKPTGAAAAENLADKVKARGKKEAPQAPASEPKTAQAAAAPKRTHDPETGEVDESELPPEMREPGVE